MLNKLISISELVYRKLDNKFNCITQNSFATILMLHRVRTFNPNNLPFFESMNIDPVLLKKKLVKYICDGYKFISLDELLIILEKRNSEKHEKLLVLTVDDGYIDTYTNLFPILNELQIPFTFYVASSFPNKKIALWWNFLNDLLINCNSIQLYNKIKLDNSTIQKKQRNYILLSREILKMGNEIHSQFDNLFQTKYEEVVQNYSKELIDWCHINEMSKSSLCTIGAHTDMHFGLRFSQLKDIRKDVYSNKEDIIRYTGKTPFHFAYPYGTFFSVGFREFRLIEQLGFKSGVNTFSAGIFASDHRNTFSLPRVVLNND